MSELYVDPAHRVPDAEWAEVVRRAQEIHDAALENKTGGAASPAGPITDMRGRSNKHSGISGLPTQLLVLHSAECPLRGGFAQSLTEWAITSAVIASWQRFIDPIARVYMIDDQYAAWHASEANPMSIGWEQAGYARFTFVDWTTPDGMLQMESLAYDMAQVALRDGIPPVWLTTEQVTAITTYGDRTTKGFCCHRQIDPESRTDPGNGYPYDLLMQKIRAYMGSGTLASSGATTPTNEGFLMALSDDEQQRILAAADRTNGVIDDPHAKVLTTNHLTAIGLAVLKTDIPWFGFGGSIPTDGRQVTSLETLAGWHDTGTAGLQSAVVGLTELVRQLSLATGVTIDYKAIAKAVNDDAANRMDG